MFRHLPARRFASSTPLVAELDRLFQQAAPVSRELAKQEDFLRMATGAPGSSTGNPDRRNWRLAHGRGSRPVCGRAEQEKLQFSWGQDGLIRLIPRNGDVSAAFRITTDGFESGWHAFLHERYGLP